MGKLMKCANCFWFWLIKICASFFYIYRKILIEWKRTEVVGSLNIYIFDSFSSFQFERNHWIFVVSEVFAVSTIRTIHHSVKYIIYLLKKRKRKRENTWTNNQWCDWEGNEYRNNIITYDMPSTEIQICFQYAYVTWMSLFLSHLAIFPP